MADIDWWTAHGLLGICLLCYAAHNMITWTPLICIVQKPHLSFNKEFLGTVVAKHADRLCRIDVVMLTESTKICHKYIKNGITNCALWIPYKYKLWNCNQSTTVLAEDTCTKSFRNTACTTCHVTAIRKKTDSYSCRFYARRKTVS